VLLVSIGVYVVSFVLLRTLSRYREYAADRGVPFNQVRRNRA